MWLSKYKEYPNRQLEIMNGKTKQVVPFDANKLDGVRLKLKIDVGPSTKWSEAAMVQAIMNMMEKQWITFVEGLERLPDTVIPNKQGLLEARQGQADADKKYIYDLSALVVKMFTPEAQNQFQGLSVEDAKNQLEKMVESKQPLPIQQQAPQEAPQQKPPSVSISFKDLPPSGMIQAAAEANIHLTPDDIAQYQVSQLAQKTQGGATNGVPNMQG
jgi:ribosomal protein L22